jgi:hypothetical protein
MHEHGWLYNVLKEYLLLSRPCLLLQGTNRPSGELLANKLCQLGLAGILLTTTMARYLLPTQLFM